MNLEKAWFISLGIDPLDDAFSAIAANRQLRPIGEDLLSHAIHPLTKPELIKAMSIYTPNRNAEILVIAAD
jgi:hypothetical protein